MYKAIEKIGEYKIGDIVPDEIAIAWAKRYLISPVEKVGKSDKKEEVDEPALEVDEPEDSNNVMLDDYLGRNTETVVKNIKEDNLSIKILDSLLVLEESNKGRKKVINSIKNKLKN